MSNALRSLSRHAGKCEPVPSWVKDASLAGPRLSQLVIDVAKPLLDSARTEEDYRKSILIALFCWNLPLTPEDKRPALMRELLDEVIGPGESPADVERMIADIVARKEALYPDDKRLIIDHTFVREGKDMTFFVKYAADQPPSGVACTPQQDRETR
jgi:hypothetical protein